MPKQIFVNLPVRDLEKSKQFFAALGLNVDTQFADENATSVIISESIHVMLLQRDFFKTFTNKEIADSSTSTETLIALSAESKDEVDGIADRAIEAGGREFREPQDHSFMYARSFEDLDGHMWEILWVDPAFQEPGEIT